MAGSKLAVHFQKQPVIDTGFNQGTPETAQCRAVRHLVSHAGNRETAEGKAVVHLLFYLTVTQAVPCPHEFHAGQHHAVVTGTPRSGEALGVGRLYQGAQRLPVDHGVYVG